MTKPSSERRSFLTSIKAGLTSLAAVSIGSVALAQQKPSAASGRFEPARHEKDDWLDKIPGKHRMVFDTISPIGLAQAMAFANNFIRVNRTDYGLQNEDSAVVMIARDASTPFAFNDAMWAKYGKPMAGRSSFEDPKTKEAPKTNIYNAADYGDLLRNRGTTLDALAKQGVQFAVCSVATRGLAGVIAQATGGKVDDINAELIANLIGSARMVPAGIVAVNRAQERGYTLVS